MYCFNYLVILTLCCCVLCQIKETVDKIEETSSNESEERREGKQLTESIEHGGWKILNSNEWQNSEEWMPKSSPLVFPNDVPENSMPRRRRIRKRKRRPPVYVNSEENEETPQPRRKTRPQTLEDINNSWPEIENETSKRPYNRRRITPIYSPEETSETRTYEKVRDPYTALEEVEAKARLKKKQEQNKIDETTTVSHLKALLKQSGTSLNLSELLQQKNLSLDDLLKGKQQAISALTEKSEMSTEPVTEYKTVEFTDDTKAEEVLEKNTSRNYEISNESTEMLIPKKASTTPHNYEIITQPTTDRRIFVPSHPKYYTSFSYKPNLVRQFTESTTQPITQKTTNAPNLNSNYRSKYASLMPKLRNSLPITSAKQKMKNDSAAPSTSIPPKEAIANATKPNQEGPLKMTIDLESAPPNDHQTIKKDLPPMDVSENEIGNTETTTVLNEKIKSTSAREEIMEILKDHISRQNLSRILHLRNMTIEELVAQRERGSSQLHLADIFHNQTREPEPPNEPFVGHVAEVPRFLDRKPKTISNPIEVKTDTDGSNYVASVIDLKPLKLNRGKDSTNVPGYSVTSFPTYKIEMEKILKHNQPPPFQLSIWKSLYPNLYSGSNEGSAQKVEEILGNEIDGEVEGEISEAVNDQLNNKNYSSEEDDDAAIRFPTGVKSAIIASAAIVGISLLVFLTIFMIFKWSHKQKKRMCYSDTFSCSRIKSPILETTPRRTIRTIMSETLGRKKRYANVYPQSMSDYVWESDKKPFQ